MDPLSFLSNAEPGALDAMYARYLQDPESVDRSWRLFFAGFDLSRAQYGEDAASPATLKEFKVLDLIHGYRTRGHLFTQTNPVRARRTYLPTLDLAQFDLSEADLNTVFQAGQRSGVGACNVEGHRGAPRGDVLRIDRDRVHVHPPAGAPGVDPRPH